ncbi:hypothetical protein ABC383_19920 [Noviherbaspirillum sp. 1P10PC]|uniref:hypothetical protein n=1 Tax=Noviherbaspirillum sp. 1P10PC TaxID=3132292 RepID=UPI0039A07FC1
MIATTKRAILSAFSGCRVLTEAGDLIGVGSICNQGHTWSRPGMFNEEAALEPGRIVPRAAWTVTSPLLFAGAPRAGKRKEILFCTGHTVAPYPASNR